MQKKQVVRRYLLLRQGEFGRGLPVIKGLLAWCHQGCTSLLPVCIVPLECRSSHTRHDSRCQGFEKTRMEASTAGAARGGRRRLHGNLGPSPGGFVAKRITPPVACIARVRWLPSACVHRIARDAGPGDIRMPLTAQATVGLRPIAWGQVPRTHARARTHTPFHARTHTVMTCDISYMHTGSQRVGHQHTGLRGVTRTGAHARRWAVL